MIEEFEVWKGPKSGITLPSSLLDAGDMPTGKLVCVRVKLLTFAALKKFWFANCDRFSFGACGRFDKQGLSVLDHYEWIFGNSKSTVVRDALQWEERASALNGKTGNLKSGKSLVKRKAAGLWLTFQTANSNMSYGIVQSAFLINRCSSKKSCY